jgi:RNA polymerase sigma factor (sigma-70 family)
MNQNDFVLLVAPFKDKVFRLAKRLLVSTAEAEDATQEIWVKLWSKNGTLSGYSSIEAFAMTMTKNYCLDQLKSKRSGNLKLVHTNYTDAAPAIDKKLEDYDTLNWVERSISQLPEQQRIIIQLRDIEQYEFKEMAEMLNMTESAIRVTLSRARKTIREYMTKTHNYGIV